MSDAADLIGFSDAISNKKYFVQDSVFDAEMIQELRKHADKLKQTGQFYPSRIGRGESLHKSKETRGDELSWITKWSASPLKEVSDLFETLVEKSRIHLSSFQSLMFCSFNGIMCNKQCHYFICCMLK